MKRFNKIIRSEKNLLDVVKDVLYKCVNADMWIQIIF